MKCAAAGLLSLLAACAASSRTAATPSLPGFENSLGMQFVRVPAGDFVMGSDDTPERLHADFPDIEPERLSALVDETPAHAVRITRSFFIGRHEVTVGQFARFLRESGYRPESVADGTGGYGFDPDYDPARSPRGDAFDGRDPKYSWRNPGFPQGDDHPVVNVTWNDAQALTNWLSRTEGRTYRLPTEAEWEYACRAGGHSRYQAGDLPATLLGTANVFDHDSARHWPRWEGHALAGRDGFAFTSPVGRFAPNAWGIHDMHGNAWEWVADWYGEDYYARSPRDDPAGPDTGMVRVRRGGSWHTWPFYARASFRNWNTQQTRYVLVGMRLVLEAD